MNKHAEAVLLDFLVTESDVYTFFLQMSALKLEFYPPCERNNFGNLRTTSYVNKRI